MAVRKMQAAINSGTSGATGGSAAAPSSADGLLSLTDDELSALMPSAVGSATSQRRGETVGAPSAARPTPKQSGRFVTDGGRLAAPKIVKRSTKLDQAVPHKASGAYAKAVAAKPNGAGRTNSTTPPPRGASTKLEDFSDLVAEIESLDVTEDEQTVLISYDQLGARPAEPPSVRAAKVDVEATIAEAVRAALPQLATVPLSLATVAASVPESKPRNSADASASRPHGAMPLAPARALADVAAPAAPTAVPEPQAERAPAPRAPAKRARSVIGTLLMATALLGSVAAGAWVAGDVWAVRGHVVPPQTGQMAIAPAPAPAPEPAAAPEPASAPEPSVAEAEPSAAETAPVLAAEPAAPSDVPTSAPSTATKASSAAPVAAKAAAVGPTGSPSSESAAAMAPADPAKESRAASKPARRARSSKGSDEAKPTGEASADVDEETKKALEALQKSQLESSF